MKTHICSDDKTTTWSSHNPKTQSKATSCCNYHIFCLIRTKKKGHICCNDKKKSPLKKAIKRKKRHICCSSSDRPSNVFLPSLILQNNKNCLGWAVRTNGDFSTKHFPSAALLHRETTKEQKGCASKQQNAASLGNKTLRL